MNVYTEKKKTDTRTANFDQSITVVNEYSKTNISSPFSDGCLPIFQKKLFEHNTLYLEYTFMYSEEYKNM
jgi:hypothetical protein